MPISQIAIDNFLHKNPVWIPPFKGADPDWLRATIFDVTGKAYKPKTQPRPHQLEGVAFALYQQQALLFYSMRLGKALRHDCPVATPEGWRAIGDLSTGDKIMSPSGSPVEIVGVFPQGRRPMYWVTFTDGAGVACDADHLWAVNSAARRHLGQPFQVKPLSVIMQDQLRDPGSKGYRYFIPVSEPVAYPTADLPIDPYLLGVLLGDGALSSITPSVTTDKEIVDSLILPPGVTAKSRPHGSTGIVKASLSMSSGRSNPLLDALRALGLSGCLSEKKFIPPQYLTADVSQRLALLAGLLDTDGGNEGQSNLHWGSISLDLAQDMQELVRSLGGTAKRNTKPSPKFTYKGEHRTGQPYYHMSVRLPATLGCPFRLTRKADCWTPLMKFQPQRAIASIEPIEAAEAVCIKVDSPDGLFVVKDYVVTHNTLISLQWAEQLRAAGKWRGKGIIICHAPIGLDVWEGEVAKHSRLTIYPVRNQIDELLAGLESDADLLVIPWSGLQNIFTEMRPNRKGKNKLYPDYDGVRIAAEAFQLAIVDEIQSAKSPTSLRFLLAKELLRHCPFRLGLTGTPFGRNLYDLWTQAYLIDRGATLGHNYHFFEAAFGVRRKNHFSGQWEYLFDKKLQPLLEEKLSAISLAYKLEECQKVSVWPGQVTLQISGDQLTAYEECIDKLVQLNANQQVEIKNIFLRLRQISSGFVPFIDSFGNELAHCFKTNVKLEWMKAFLPEVQEAKASWIIFHEFTRTGKSLCDLLEQSGMTYRWLHGATKDKAQAVADFQAKRAQVLVVQSATGSFAIDLHMADLMTFYESPVSPIVRAQAEARPLSAARGDRPLLMDDLTCSGVERKILEYIKTGKDLLSAIIHDRNRLAREERTHGPVQ